MKTEKARTTLANCYGSGKALNRREFICLLRDAGVDVRWGKGGEVVLTLERGNEIRRTSMDGHGYKEVGPRYFKPVIKALGLHDELRDDAVEV